MNQEYVQQAAPESTATAIHWAGVYDALRLWQLPMLGRGERVWQAMLDRAGLIPGDRVLDVACRTGALAFKARARTGEAGCVVGIDPSQQMITAAGAKAQRAKVAVEFWAETVERMPFPDNAFDAVLSSLAMRRLTAEQQRQGVAEIWRVLKPGGRLVILDYKRPDSYLPRALLPLTLPHWMQIGVQDLRDLLSEAGFDGIEYTPARVKFLGVLFGCARK